MVLMLVQFVCRAEAHNVTARAAVPIHSKVARGDDGWWAVIPRLWHDKVRRRRQFFAFRFVPSRRRPSSTPSITGHKFEYLGAING